MFSMLEIAVLAVSTAVAIPVAIAMANDYREIRANGGSLKDLFFEEEWEEVE